MTKSELLIWLVNRLRYTLGVTKEPECFINRVFGGDGNGPFVCRRFVSSQGNGSFCERHGYRLRSL